MRIFVRLKVRFFVLLLLLSASACRAQSAPPPAAPSAATPSVSALQLSTLQLSTLRVPVVNAEAIEVVLPSALPSGVGVNDAIDVQFYPALVGRQLPKRGVPAVVLLHYLGAAGDTETRHFAWYLRERGIACAIVTLPWHRKRLPPDDSPYNHYLGVKADIAVQAWNQAASDVSTTVTWLLQQRGIDPQRVASIGVSLGAIVTHLVMGRDARVRAGVAFLGGGDFPDINKRSILRTVLGYGSSRVEPGDEAKLRSVDPLSEAALNRPRRVLMVEAARDLIVPPRNAEALWNALGRPPILWLDINHVGLELAQRQAQAASYKFLLQAWSDAPQEKLFAPRLYTPTLKAGFLIGADEGFTPALTLQFLNLGVRDHMALLHADAGLGLRGPFVGAAVTINQFVDVGVGRRVFAQGRAQLYTSFHVAF